MVNRRTEKAFIAVISMMFVFWSTAFIYRSSVIAIDGKRYFGLFDDAMISMRYAWNFSHGAGLLWNSGEYVQGYTNLLMTLLMSFATFVLDKSAAVLSIQVAGVVFVLASAFISVKLSSHVTPIAHHQYGGLTRVLIFLCVVCYYPLVYWSELGMETGLLTVLVLSEILLSLNYTKSRKPRVLFLVAGLMGLAYWTRNDSLIFAGLIWLYLFREAFTSRVHRRFVLLAATFYVLFVIAQHMFQYTYYGEWLPNTYTLKLTGMRLVPRITNGLVFVKPFLVQSSFILVLSTVDLLFDYRKQKLLLLSFVLAAIGYQVYVGGDPWSYWRIMSPSFPLLFILFVHAIVALIIAVSTTQGFNAFFLRNPIVPVPHVSHFLIASLVLLGLSLVNYRFWQEISLLALPYQTNATQENINTAIALNQVTTREATIGVFWAGTLPYYVDRNAVDFLGKSDKYVAGLLPDMSGAVGWSGMTSVPGHNKYDLTYSIKTLKPTYIQGYSWGAQDLSDWAEGHYVAVEYKGVSLLLLKNSPAVLWTNLNLAQR